VGSARGGNGPKRKAVREGPLDGMEKRNGSRGKRKGQFIPTQRPRGIWQQSTDDQQSGGNFGGHGIDSLSEARGAAGQNGPTVLRTSRALALGTPAPRGPRFI